MPGRRSHKPAHPAEFYTCPKCGGSVRWSGRDPEQREVYECNSCGRRVGEATLEYHDQQRKLRD
jgi:hypothetical protein